ncbi:hypothetical protein J3R30DRAFT_3439149 [Lentinula aciculospora]|uniref:Uncharacterized protein n=1 Tax=Lentinula aciculospora TaxID=153920 RepID=A0A9W9AL75_9AGAR|nr:hypothetical protein J3R30DRAFT_3439149 [Lentinula aciculospora]
MGFQKYRVGHAGAPISHKKKRATDSSCLTGGFYTNPASGASVDSLKTLNITWDTSCLTPSNDEIDIYLYAPSAATPRLHLWEDVPFTKGYYEAELMPRWWNSTSSEQLQLLIIQSGDAPFLATLPAGPVFTATYSTPSSGAPESAQTELASTDSGITEVQSTASSSSSSHLSGGKIAAAVIIPLLVVAAVAAYFWIRRSRAKGKEERKVWSEKVDQRMSVVSADWQSISPAGAQAAIRNSMAIRASMEAEARMSVNLAGMGVQAPGGGVGGFFIPGQGDPTVNPIIAMPVPSLPATAQLRPGLRSSAYSTAAAAARVSRVSFAAEPAIPGRPSGESRRSIYDRERPSFDSSQRRSGYSQYSQNSANRGSRAFHYADGEMPPMPEGAAERASQFYALNGNTNFSSLGSGMSASHMNISSSTLNSSLDASRMSRLSRFDEVYGEEYSGEYPAEYENGSREEGAMSPTQTMGPVALSTDDIKRRISMRQSSANASFDGGHDDVGPALTMMRAQDQDSYFNHNSGTSETIFTTSPSPNQTSFPSFPMPSGSHISSPIVELHSGTNGASSPSSYTGMAPPKSGMSPDDMLRAYAERKAAAGVGRVGTPKISNPSPLAREVISYPTEEQESGKAM